MPTWHPSHGRRRLGRGKSSLGCLHLETNVQVYAAAASLCVSECPHGRLGAPVGIDRRFVTVLPYVLRTYGSTVNDSRFITDVAAIKEHSR